MEHILKLHDNKDVFDELVSRAASHFEISELYVEKDYWVTMVLMRLSQSEFRDFLVFKGGTSLSKSYKIIQRFSEDVDLAVFPVGLSGNQIKKRIKAAENAITYDLVRQERHPNESLGSQFRKTYHQYPSDDHHEKDFGQVSPSILLEINAFAEPSPHHLRSIQSLVGEYLESISKYELVREYALSPFEVNVLSVERTCVEKIIGLVRACREENYVDRLREKIRHVYDLCMILRDCDQRAYINSPEFKGMVSLVISADRQQFGDNAQRWLGDPIDQAIIFTSASQTWSLLSSEFKGNFAEMVYNDDIPSDNEVISTLEDIGHALSECRDEGC